jgi:ribonuclease BN (tRNA processing enzyme)
VYATDTEHFSCPDPKLVKLADGADLLIYDAQYDDEEYAGLAGPPRTGWGHSTFSEGVRVADAARVRQLALYHHDPTHSDEKVRELERRAAILRPGSFACREGQTVVLAAAAAHATGADSASAATQSPQATRAEQGQSGPAAGRGLVAA